MFSMRAEVDRYLAQISKTHGDSTNDDEWAALVDEGAIHKLRGGTASAKSAAEKVLRWRRVHRGNEPKPVLLGPRTRGRKNSYLGWHQEAVSDIFAAHAEEDERRFGVRGFRADALPEGLLLRDQVAPWIEGRAATRAVAVSADSAPARVETLAYGRSDSKWTHRVVVTPGSILARLRTVARGLAEFYGWDEAQATVFVLTGLTPLTHAIRTTVMRSSPLVVRSRIKMSVDPATTPREVADEYRRIRRGAFGRIRRLGEKHARLAAFVVRLPNGMDTSEQLSAWNVQCVKWRRNKWRFSQPSRFRIEAQKAVERLVEMRKV